MSNTCIALAFQGASDIRRHRSMFTDDSRSSSDRFRLSPSHFSDAFDAFWDSSTLSAGTTPAYRVEYEIIKEHFVGCGRNYQTQLGMFRLYPSSFVYPFPLLPLYYSICPTQKNVTKKIKNSFDKFRQQISTIFDKVMQRYIMMDLT